VTLLPCTQPVDYCVPPFAAPAGFEGGTAYDPIARVYWITNGVLLASVLADFGSCDMECLGPSPVANASGLAFHASTSDLWILGIGGELARAAFTGGTYCPVVQSRCSLAALLPAGAVTAGLALSEKNGLLFIAVSAGGAAPINRILVAPLADPCQPVCTIDLGRAYGTPQGSPITGLGFDDCDDELFAVAGDGGIARARLAFPGCSIVAQSTCTPPGARFHGLCVQPQPVGSFGHSCETAPCARCGTVRLRANDPSLGNRSFAIWVLYGQTGSLLVPVASVGPCGSGTPFLCGRAFVALSPPPVLFPLQMMNGPSTCTGFAAIPLPVPAQAMFCGLQFCVQAALLCPQGGTALTNALGVRVTGA
jgi:hypothetical protein